jgi:hypothetical protein
MGVDIYLNSIWEPWVDTRGQTSLSRHRGKAKTPDDFIRMSEELFDKARASGGYFRNAYNTGDVMWAMGLSWRNDVGKMLDSKRRLPIDQARALIAKIEARPLTRERVARHIFEQMTDRVVVHPVAGGIADLTGAAPSPAEVEGLFAFLGKRRDGLLTILRKSVALGEPLVCSL